MSTGFKEFAVTIVKVIKWKGQEMRLVEWAMKDMRRV